jgi:transcriptional regulator with XRE-family HTH domain
LGAAGIGVKQVAELSGLAYSTVARLLWGDGPGTPKERVRADTAARILAIDPSADNLAAGGRIDATGTRRRLQALMALGWTQASLARQLHRGTCSVRRTLASRTVTVATAAAVRELYEQLSNTAPEEGTPARRHASQAARARAHKRGWLPPLAWDDIDTDGELASATPRGDDVDDLDVEIVIERLSDGRQVNLNNAERDEVIRRLTQRGHSLEQIAAALGVCTRTVSRRRAAA